MKKTTVDPFFNGLVEGTHLWEPMVFTPTRRNYPVDFEVDLCMGEEHLRRNAVGCPATLDSIRCHQSAEVCQRT